MCLCTYGCIYIDVCVCVCVGVCVCGYKCVNEHVHLICDWFVEELVSCT